MTDRLTHDNVRTVNSSALEALERARAAWQRTNDQLQLDLSSAPDGVHGGIHAPAAVSFPAEPSACAKAEGTGADTPSAVTDGLPLFVSRGYRAPGPYQHLPRACEGRAADTYYEGGGRKHAPQRSATAARREV